VALSFFQTNKKTALMDGSLCIKS